MPKKQSSLQIPKDGSATPSEENPTTYEASKKEEALLSYIRDREDSMEEAVSEYLDEWEEFNGLYENLVTTDDDDIVNVNFPTEYSVIETRMAKEYQSLPAARIIPVEEGDSFKAELLEDLIVNAESVGMWDWERFKIMLAKHILGTGIQKNTIRREVRTKKMPVGVDKKTEKIKYEEKDVVIFDDIYKKYIDLRYFRIDDKATSMEDARDCLEYMPMSMDEFLQKYDGKLYKNVDKVKAYGADVVSPKATNPSNEESKRIYAKFDTEVLVTEYYSIIKDLMAVRANGVIILEQPIPYFHKELPYVRYLATAMMNSFYGRGAPRLLKAIKAIKNILWNTALRKALIANKPVIVMPKRAGWKSENFKFEEGAVWRVPFDPNTIRVLESSGLKQDLLTLLKNVDDEIPLAYGVDPRAILPSPKETATKTSTREEISNERVELGLKLTEMNSLVRSTKMDISNIKQLYSEKRILRITEKDEKTGEVTDRNIPQMRTARFPGKEYNVKKLKTTNKYYLDGITPMKGDFSWLEIRPEFLNGDYDVIVTTTQLPFSKAFRQERDQRFYETLQGHPNINQAELVGRYVVSNDGDKDKLVMDPQQEQNPKIAQLALGGRSPEELGTEAPTPPMPTPTPPA